MNEEVYKLLQNVDKSVHKCTLCHGLVEKFPNTDTVFLGRIMILC